MLTIPQIAREIALIGEKVVSCRLQCAGINLNEEEGILPRALFFETDKRTSENGSIVLGINPGRAKVSERLHYLKYGSTYETLLAYERVRLRTPRYVLRLKHFLSSVNLDGPILWTELVKCENPPSVESLPPINTIRSCVSRHLVKELSFIPDWPIIAVGKAPFELAAIMFPARPVLGIPHPNSYGHFDRLFSNNQLKQEFIVIARSAITETEPRARWITG